MRGCEGGWEVGREGGRERGRKRSVVITSGLLPQNDPY